MNAPLFCLVFGTMCLCVCIVLMRLRTDNLQVRVENIENRLEQYHIIERLKKIDKL